MKKLLLLLFSILISLQSSGHRYWKYENSFTPNHHPRVSRIYVITEDGGYVDFPGASFTSDNCSDIGTVPSTGATYTVDLGATNKVQEYGFYATYGTSSRTTVASLYYSDDNYSWTQLEHQQITTDRGCGEYNRNVEYNENDQIQLTGNFKDGKKDGIWTSWYEHGQKKEELNYKDGDLVYRTVFKYYGNNQIESEKNYNKVDQREGKLISWYESGQQKKNFNYKKDQLDGKRTIWYESGQKESEANYKNGKLDGKSTRWYESGHKKSEANYKNEENYERGKLDGKWTSWYENGQMKSENHYKDGKKDGIWTSWYEHGQKYIEGSYKDEKPDDKWTIWHGNGLQEEELNYKDGDLVDSTIFKYYDNNQIESEKKYKQDRLNGKAIFWHRNGQKFIEGGYKDQIPDGKWTFWHRNGQQEEELNYKDGDLVDRTIFKYGYFTGHLKSKKKYKDDKCISGC